MATDTSFEQIISDNTRGEYMETTSLLEYTTENSLSADTEKDNGVQSIYSTRTGHKADLSHVQAQQQIQKTTRGKAKQHFTKPTTFFICFHHLLNTSQKRTMLNLAKKCN
jgi:hypothetical protein